MVSINQIYDTIESAVNLVGRPVYCASKREPIPESFPACYIVEDDHSFIRSAIPLNFSDAPLTRNFSVEVYSSLTNGALTEAREIMDDVEEVMMQLGFIETYCGQTNNADPSVTRIVGRFTRVFGANDPLEIE